MLIWLNCDWKFPYACRTNHFRSSYSVHVRTSKAPPFFEKVLIILLQFNLLVCAVMLFVSIYLTALGLFNRRFADPLRNVTPENPKYIDYGHSAMSIVIMWIVAVVFGYVTHLFKLPALLGVLVCGILFRNISTVSNQIFIDSGLNAFVRKTAFTIILIRGGIGLDPKALKKCKIAISKLGIVSPVVEAFVIATLAVVTFKMDILMSLIFGITLAATSPAVTIPTMLGLNEKGYGVQSGVSTVLLAAAAVDNMICLTFTNIFLGVIFSKQSIAAMIGTIILQIVFGTAVGLGSGYLLWWFPRTASRQLHFTRGIMLECLSLAFIFGGQAIDWYSAGVIATILCSIMASIRWKTDNEKKANKESESFALIWDLIGMQVMFVLIGNQFLFSALRLEVVLKGMGILIVGTVTRTVSVYMLLFCGSFNMKERSFMSLSFFPKATVQAALIPQIIDECNGTKFEPEAQIIMQICILAIVITAPLGQFILQLYGPLALGKDPQYHKDDDDNTVPLPATNSNVLSLQINVEKPQQIIARIPQTSNHNDDDDNSKNKNNNNSNNNDSSNNNNNNRNDNNNNNNNRNDSNNNNHDNNHSKLFVAF